MSTAITNPDEPRSRSSRSLVSGAVRQFLGLLFLALVARASLPGSVAAVDAPPTITQEPRDVGIAEGAHFHLAASVAGAEAFQWFKEAIPLIGDDQITGVTTTFLGVTNVVASDAGAYWLVASNAFGMVTSRVAQVIVEAAPRNSWLDEWTRRLGSPTTAPFAAESAIYANGEFVAVDRLGILGSPNGIVWERLATIPDAKGFRVIATDSDLFVAVGSGGDIFTSPDAREWTRRASPVTVDILSVTQGNGRWVAVTSNARILTSTDGLAWRLEPFIAPRTLNEVVFLNGQFFAVGANGTILTSADGHLWSTRSTGRLNTLLNATTDGQTYVVVGDAGAIENSVDGITWRRASFVGDGATGFLYDVVYGGGRFVASGSAGKVYVSTDGRSWRTDPISAQTELRALAFGGGRFVALALGKVVFSEGTGFNLVPSPTSQLLSVTYGNGRFVAAAARSAFVSADAVTWIERYRSTFTIKSITYANDRFLALSGQGFIAVSQDGKNWTERYLAKGGEMRGAAYGNGRYVIVAFYGDVLTSPDAVTWTLERSAIQRIRFTGVAFGKGMFVATSEDGAIHTSEDGAQWTQVASEPGVALRSITFGLDRFVAVGSQGVVLSSVDGKSWTSLSVGEPVQLTAVSYGEGVFIAVGASLTGWSSTDGRIWRPHVTRAPAASISYGEGAFVVASGSSVYSASPQLLQIQPLLAIVTPPADQEADFGSTATLRVEATSPGTLRYQWRFNGLPLPGQTNAELVLRNVSIEHQGSYVVEVSDENGTDTTPPAVLAVKRPPPDGLDDWAPRLPWPTSAHLEGVASGKGLLVAVGSNGAILVSADGGAFWNARSSAHAGSLNSVAFGNGRFVAVGANGSVVSDDADKWDAKTQLYSFNAVTFAEDRFVASAAGGLILVSTDGIEWERRLARLNTEFLTLLHANGRTIAAGAGTNLVWSDDLVNWTNAWPASQMFAGSAYGGGQFVLVGKQNTLAAVATSTTGITWSIRTLSTSSTLRSVAYANGTFIAVGDDATSLISTDAVGWTALRAAGWGADLREVIIVNNQPLAVGEFGTIIAGTNWSTRVSTGPGPTWTAAAAGKNRFAVGGRSGRVRVSLDSISWNEAFIPVSAIRALLFDGERFVAAGTPGPVMHSADGLTWVKGSGAGADLGAFYGGTHSRHGFILVGANGSILRSADGIQWSRREALASVKLNGAASSDTRIAIVGDGGTIFTSADGVNWTARASGVPSNLLSVVYGTNRFVAVGNGGTVVVSTNDGESWESQPSPFGVWPFGVSPEFQAPDLTCVSFADGWFLAGGPRGTLFSSRDGREWKRHFTGTPSDINALAHLDGRVIAAGANGTVISSDIGRLRFVPPEIVAVSGNVSAFVGETITLSVTARGTEPLSYHWFGNDVVGDPDRTTGTKSPAMTIRSARASDSGNYGVRVSNPAGFVEHKGIVVSVVNPVPPQFTRHPNDMEVFAGSTVRLFADASGSPAPQFRWLIPSTAVIPATNLFKQILSIDSANLEHFGSYAVVAENAFGAVTSRVAIVRVHTTEELRAKTATWLPPEGADVRDITIHEGQALVAMGEGGLAVMDVGQPLNPQLLGRVDTAGIAHRVAGVGFDFFNSTMAAVANGPGGLVLVDVSAPARPFVRTRVSSRHLVWGVGAFGNSESFTVFTAEGNAGTRTFAGNRDGSLVETGAWPLPGYANAVTASGLVAIGDAGVGGVGWVRDTPGYALDVASTESEIISARKVVAADGPAGLQVFQTESDGGLSLTAGVKTAGIAYGVALAGDYFTDYAFVADGPGGLAVVQLNASPPKLIAQVDLPGHAWQVEIAGKYAFVALGTAGLHVIELPYAVNPAPVILRAPNSRVFDAGETISLNVVATGGEPLRYRWEKEGGFPAGEPRITGIDTPTLTIRDAARDDAGLYRLHVIRGDGFNADSAYRAVRLWSRENAARLEVTRVNNRSQLILSGEAGRSYELQSSTNLFDWNSDGWVVAQGQGTPVVVKELDFTAATQRFFRAVTR